MLTPHLVRAYVAALAALVAVLLVATLVQSAPAVGGTVAPAGTVSPTPTDTPTPTETPTPTPTPPDPSLLLPDVVALRATDLAIQTRRDGRVLRFTSSLGNVGRGPLEVRPNKNQPCPAGEHNSTQILYRDVNSNGRYNWRRDVEYVRHRAGCMVFHPYHDHWHFKASARYTLLDPGADGAVVVSTRRKVSFCLRDSARVPERYGPSALAMAYGSCSRWEPQGITAGWMDVYQSFLSGQSLRLPRRLADGVYCLHTTVDPLNQLAESDDTNNQSVRALAIRGDRVLVRPPAKCQ